MNNLISTGISTGIIVVAMATATSALAVEQNYITQAAVTRPNAYGFPIHNDAAYQPSLRITPTAGNEVTPSATPFASSFTDDVSSFYEQLLTSQVEMKPSIAEKLNERAWDFYLE